MKREETSDVPQNRWSDASMRRISNANIPGSHSTNVAEESVEAEHMGHSWSLHFPPFFPGSFFLLSSTHNRTKRTMSAGQIGDDHLPEIVIVRAVLNIAFTRDSASILKRFQMTRNGGGGGFAFSISTTIIESDNRENFSQFLYTNSHFVRSFRGICESQVAK